MSDGKRGLYNEHKRDESVALEVVSMAESGVPQKMMAKSLGMSPKTLRKHYRAELDTAMVLRIQEVAGALFANAKGGDTTAQIFFLKTQAKWTADALPEDMLDDGDYDFTKLSDDDVATMTEIMERARVDTATEDA